MAEFVKTRREHPKSAPYLRLKIFNEQLLETFGIFFSKVFLENFFSKKVFSKKAGNAEKLKRGHSGSFNVFANRKLQKNSRGYPLIEFEKFRKESRIVPKKNQRGDPMVSPLLLEV